MSISKFLGGLITKNPPTPSGPYETSTAPGVWTMTQVANYVKQGLWPTAGNPAPDPYFEYVTMLLHGDGTNGGQNNTFVDSSTNNFSITRNGNTTQGSFSPYGSLWSNYFDGTGDYLSVANNTALNVLSGGDFTIECFVFFNAVPSNSGYGTAILAKGATSDGWLLRATPTDFGLVYPGLAGNYVSFSFSVGQWYHVVAQRSSSSVVYYINGTRYTPSSYSNRTADSSVTLTLGNNVNDTGNTANLSGYISSARIVKGTAVYSGSTITVPTSPLTAVSGTSLLTCQSNRFIDNSSNNFTITRTGDTSVTNFAPFSPSYPGYTTATNGGSGFFGVAAGTIANLSSSPSGLSSMSTWTMEFWAYNFPTGGTSDQAILGPWQPNLIRTSGATSFEVYLASGLRINGSYWTRGQWNHVALANDGTSLRLYINGVLLSSVSPVTINLSSMVIGSEQTTSSANDKWNGYITDFRVLNGVALYSGSTITVPSAPLTAVTNTSLLLNFTNGAIFDNSMKNDLETVGNAQISTSVKKYGTGSLAFDGTGDWLLGPSNTSVGLGTGAFTVEMWVYPTANTGNGPGTLFDARNGANAEGWVLRIFSDLSVGFYDGPSNVYQQTAASAISLNTWTHLAFVRSGTTLTIYVNGVSAKTATVSNNLGSAWPFYVGNNYSAGYTYTGYIDDLRITNGVARYTANFTPPTQAFVNF